MRERKGVMLLSETGTDRLYSVKLRWHFAKRVVSTLGVMHNDTKSHNPFMNPISHEQTNLICKA